MALTLEQLTTPQTADNIRSQMVTSLVSLGIPANLWRAGGVASTILTVVSLMLASTSLFVADVIKGFFLPLATGDGLILLAKYMYGVDAPAATFASGYVTLTNAGGAVYSGKQPGTLIFSDGTTNYVNTSVVNIPALSTVVIPVEATITGTVGNAAPGAVTTMVTTLLGVTVSNPTAIIGSDAIGDAALRQLCLDSFGANSPYGPRSAYAYAIKTAINSVTSTPVNVNRWSISPASSTGIVTIVVASPAGPVSADDLAAVSANIELLARPDTVTVNLSSATALAYTRTVIVYCIAPSGVLSANVSTACSASLVTMFENYPIGGETASDDTNPITFTGIFKDSIVGAIASGVASLGGTLISTKGAADMALTSSQVPSDGVTLVVNIIPVIGGA